MTISKPSHGAANWDTTTNQVIDAVNALGGASVLNVGTTTGTVAAGDDSRITGAAQKASNLSDLASASTARTNLGLGGAAVLNVGTASSTVAAGDDSRVVGAAQKASNLSDLASASTARTNLGLGGSAVLAVGTTTGTVAAGDDSRITGAAQKASNLSDLASVSTARANLGMHMGDTPSRHGLLEWNFSLDMMNGSTGTTPVSGTVYGMRWDAQQSSAISTITVMCGTVAAGLTSGQCVAVVINGTTGVEVGRTGNISTSFAATGPVELALTASFTPVVVTPYAVLLLFNGTTPPGLMRSNATSATQLNYGQSAASPRRYFTAGATQTAISTPVTMSGTTGSGGLSFWVGLK